MFAKLRSSLGNKADRARYASRSFASFRTHSLRIESLEYRRLRALVPELVSDFTEGTASTIFGSSIDVNGTLFFSVNDTNQVAQLWKSDGTEAGTQVVKDNLPGRGSLLP